MRLTRSGLCTVVALILVLLAGCGNGTPESSGQQPNGASASSTTPANVDLAGVGVAVDAQQFTQAEAGRNNLAAGPLVESDGLSLQAMGVPSDPGGLWFMGRGFTPRGEYVVEAFYPQDSEYSGTPYTFIRNGVADPDGSIPRARWDAGYTNTGSDDPPGIYIIRFTDVNTNRVVQTEFVLPNPR